MINDEELHHHGILGQKWGVRRYQNLDGTLTKAGQRHVKQLEKKDINWAEKNEAKIISKVYKKSSKELSKYDRQLSKVVTGKKYINAHNQKMAEIMNTKVSDLQSPSGRYVRFVAKRGEEGVYMALADAGYDMSKVKNGVWTNGRIAYKTSSVELAK